MWWAVALLAVAGLVVAWLALKKGSATPTSAQKPEGVSLTQLQPSSTTVIDAGLSGRVQWAMTVDGGIQVGTNLKIPLTLYGLGEPNVISLIRKLEQDNGILSHDWLSFTILKNGVTCKEVDAWAIQARAIVQNAVDAECAKLRDEGAGRAELEWKACENLDVRPHSDYTTHSLLFSNGPIGEAEKNLIAKFSNDPELLFGYLRFFEFDETPKIESAGQGNVFLESFKRLSELGLMNSGLDIPAADILAEFPLKKLNTLIDSKLNKTFSRKAQSIEYLKSVPNIHELLTNDPEIGSRVPTYFQAVAVPGVSYSKLKQAHHYASALSDTIIVTLQTAIKAKYPQPGTRRKNAKGRQLVSEECCPHCKAIHGKYFSLSDAIDYPPYHVGCSAEIRNV